MRVSTMAGGSGVQSEAFATAVKQAAGGSSSAQPSSSGSALLAAARGALGGSAAGAGARAGAAASSATSGGGVIADVLDSADTYARWTSAAVIAFSLALLVAGVGFIVWNVRKGLA